MTTIPASPPGLTATATSFDLTAETPAATAIVGHRRSKRRPERFTVASYIVVSVFGVFCMFPLWIILAGSFTDESTLASKGYSLWPKPFSLTAFKMLFNGGSLLQGYTASLFITIVGTALALMTTACLAWVIARNLPHISKPLTIFAYIPMLFSGGLVPLYLLVTQVLQLTNSWFSVILPIMLSPFLIFVTVTFFRQLPEEIFESARVDGAGEIRIFFQIVLPLSKPILAVVALFSAVTYWNDWFMALLFISDPSLYPLQLTLQNLISNVSNAATLGTSAAMAAAPVYQLRFAMTVLTIAPILFAYPFAQRFFVKGLTLGATKG